MREQNLPLMMAAIVRPDSVVLLAVQHPIALLHRAPHQFINI